MSPYIETIQNISDLVSETFTLPVIFIDPMGSIMYESLKKRVLNPLYENHKQKFFNPLRFDPGREYDFPVISKSAFSEKFILLSVYNNKSFEGTVLIGPSLSYPLSDERINGIINDTRAFFYRDKVFQYYKSLPVIENKQLINISTIAFNLFNHILLSTKTVSDRNGEITDQKEKIEKVNLAVSKNLQTNTFHERIFERKMLEIVKEGRVEEIKNLPYKEEEESSILSKSSFIRSVKNHIITLITLASRAAIEGGLHDEIAFSLHDQFIQQVEEVDRIDETRELAREVIYTFSRKVQQAKGEQYSKTITTCKDYIYKHIYDDLRHEDIANSVELSPKYLSALFKKEVGQSVSDYIQETKINEAKKLLAYSKTPISEICTLLNFNDQSYFTKVFKKVAGVTPKLYRERHHLLEK
ncbi:helix-turn-helix domain-containing protein [Bacillus sinesaloumensis]|uniref:helix-turn-helix domain-containing protein n=1 Tax=Litchfieldia sinesaloumensis TaxID=1926280 RepID=UPI0009884484|nr:helix-turn-helix domain-containing protein [Bacillus sinesaloumensis]